MNEVEKRAREIDKFIWHPTMLDTNKDFLSHMGMEIAKYTLRREIEAKISVIEEMVPRDITLIYLGKRYAELQKQLEQYG